MIVSINGIGSILDHLVHSEAVIVGQPQCRNIHFYYFLLYPQQSPKKCTVECVAVSRCGVTPCHVTAHGVDHQTSSVGQLPGHGGDLLCHVITCTCELHFLLCNIIGDNAQ